VYVCQRYRDMQSLWHRSFGEPENHREFTPFCNDTHRDALSAKLEANRRNCVRLYLADRFSKKVQVRSVISQTTPALAVIAERGSIIRQDLEELQLSQQIDKSSGTTHATRERRPGRALLTVASRLLHRRARVINLETDREVS